MKNKDLKTDWNVGPSKHLPTICYHSDSSFFFFSFFDTHTPDPMVSVCVFENARWGFKRNLHSH